MYKAGNFVKIKSLKEIMKLNRLRLKDFYQYKNRNTESNLLYKIHKKNFQKIQNKTFMILTNYSKFNINQFVVTNGFHYYIIHKEFIKNRVKDIPFVKKISKFLFKYFNNNYINVKQPLDYYCHSYHQISSIDYYTNRFCLRYRRRHLNVDI